MRVQNVEGGLENRFARDDWNADVLIRQSERTDNRNADNRKVDVHPPAQVNLVCPTIVRLTIGRHFTRTFTFTSRSEFDVDEQSRT